MAQDRIGQKRTKKVLLHIDSIMRIGYSGPLPPLSSSFTLPFFSLSLVLQCVILFEEILFQLIFLMHSPPQGHPLFSLFSLSSLFSPLSLFQLILLIHSPYTMHQAISASTEGNLHEIKQVLHWRKIGLELMNHNTSKVIVRNLENEKLDFAESRSTMTVRPDGQPDSDMW